MVFAQEFGKHPVFVVSRKVHVLNLNAHHIGHSGRVDKVNVGRTKRTVVVVFPIFHENADHFVALLFQQMGGDGGVDAARQSHNDTVMLHGLNYLLINPLAMKNLYLSAS